jgi:hypothetical protein
MLFAKRFVVISLVTLAAFVLAVVVAWSLGHLLWW